MYTHTHGYTLLNENKSRQSNFELLRIISMLLIVIFHFSDWGEIIKITEPLNNKFFGEFINIGGNLGVNLFVLISGYFLIDSKFKMKKLLKIILEVWTYSVGISLICFVFNIGDLKTKSLLQSILPISYNMYWFATTYIGMYILFPTINKFLNTTNYKEHINIIIILGIMLSVIPTFIPRAKPFNSNLMWFIYMYIIAAYIKKYDIKFINNNKKNLTIIALTTLLLFMLSVIITLIGLKIKFFSNFVEHFNNMYSLPMLILSISVFIYFKNINIKNNKIINIFARSSFAVYLIHINVLIRRYLFTDILILQNFYDKNTLILAGYVFISSISIYLICIVIDILRIKLIEEPIFRIHRFDKYIDKIDKFMN